MVCLGMEAVYAGYTAASGRYGRGAGALGQPGVGGLVATREALPCARIDRFTILAMLW